MQILALATLLFQCTVVNGLVRTCVVGNKTSNVWEQVDKPICRFEVKFHTYGCVSDPEVKYDIPPNAKHTNVDIIGHDCQFTGMALTCICYGQNCNSDMHSREILAREFARTQRHDYRDFILCYLTDGDKSFEIATKKKVKQRKTNKIGYSRIRRAAPSNPSPASKRQPLKSTVLQSKAITRQPPMNTTRKKLPWWTTTTHIYKRQAELNQIESAQKRENHNGPMVALDLVLALLVLVLVAVIFVLLVLTLSYTKKTARMKGEMLGRKRRARQDDDEGKPPKKLEEAVKAYSLSLASSELDAPP